ncbi:LysR family transcriptional regulator [Puniceibacterium sp. IMCC21224]|uniref:LysR family transcriptional regulator n=1 Tax=Puniceibacterium sp. IMCC21224 TaxID=1618204 RepID=UPI00064DF889|nr:LysR family transcriptional regulator [Puniceibacterium sp. IMCC21224]KMK66762.1 transcriptional regulator [Puniceibacterium sp. IMCC21224]
MNWDTLPPLSALRAFAAYADAGSVTTAGAALNVSHAAISQQLRGLEAHLGIRLLDRSGRAMTLTPEGAQLAAALETGFGHIMQTVELLTGADANRALYVTTTPSFAANWLMPRLAGFRATHVETDIMISSSAELCNPTPGGIDLAIRYGAGDWPGLQSELLVASPIVAVAAPSLIGDLVPQGPRDLTRFPWLQELGTSEATLWLERNGVRDAKPTGMMHLPGNLMLDAARSGQGIAITARVWVEEDIRAGRLRQMFEEPPGLGYHIVIGTGVQRQPLHAFTTWLRREAKR